MLIFHGDNLSASRAAFQTRKNTEKSRDLHVVEFIGNQLQLSDLVNSLQTVTLFGQSNLLVIEDFFAGKKAGKDKELIVKFLLENLDKNILIWESKNVSLNLKSFPASATVKFDLPKRLFDYLDTFSLTDLHQTLKDTEPQVIFFLLVKHLQSLLAVSSGGVTGLPAWKAAKLQSQVSKFTLSRLLQLHRELVQIDFRQKNSLSPFDLSSALEFWTAGAVK